MIMNGNITDIKICYFL